MGGLSRNEAVCGDLTFILACPGEAMQSALASASAQCDLQEAPDRSTNGPDKDSAMSEQIRLRDVFWGGRVRRSFQDRVWNIARKASVRSSRSVSGNMVSSSETYYLHFLDGGVRQSRGYFDSTCGMFCIGRHATAYVLYQLGADARVLLRDPGLPSASELKRAVEAERARHSATKGVTSPEV